jgi:putative transcriptional regulator
MVKTHIKNKIRILRFMNNEMTQQQLADMVDVTRQTIVAIENGKYSPTLELAFKIAAVFGVPLNEVFSYEPEQKNMKAKEK